MHELPKTAFLGLGDSAVSYYRCFLPAIALGAEYATWAPMSDGSVRITGGTGERVLTIGDLPDFEVVVVQYAGAKHWLRMFRELQAAGVTVLYEVDDYVQSARKSKTHELADQFDLERIRDLELAMRAADGIICSTAYIKRRYQAFNGRTWECRNAIDLKRYAWSRPARNGVTIGWSGGSGHRGSLARWEPAIRAVMRQRPDVRFVSVGHPAAAGFVEEFGPERALALPPTGIESYPASMTLFDVAFAPSAGDNYFRGKSDLRWLEASALGIPLVAHPDVYPEIEDGVTGVHARTVEEVEAALLRLVDDRLERERVGRTAHEYVAEHRSMPAGAEAWADVLREVAAGSRVAVA